MDKLHADKYLSKMVNRWDKLVFYASIVGLLVLLFFRFMTSAESQDIEKLRKLQEENFTLKQENAQLKKDISVLKENLDIQKDEN